MEPNPQTHGETEKSAAYFAGQCRKILRRKVGTDAPITTTILAHGDGDFSAQAFHTVWSEDGRENFAREVVSYNTYPDCSDQFVHGVEHYYNGHHERHTFFELDEIDDPNA